MRKLLHHVSVVALLASGIGGFANLAVANDTLDQLSQKDDNWIMPGKDYHSDNFSKLKHSMRSGKIWRTLFEN